jgi:hypothetical protein
MESTKNSTTKNND